MEDLEKQLATRFAEVLTTSVTRADVERLFKQLIDFVEHLKEALEQKTAQNKDEMTSLLQEARRNISDYADTLETKLSETQEISRSEARTITRLLRDEVERVQSLIPQMPDLAPLERKIADAIKEVEAKILPAVEVAPGEIRDKLETLKDDDRLDKSAVKGIEKIENDIREIQIRPAGRVAGAKGVGLWVNGSKKLLTAQMINFIPGTGITLTYANTNGRNDITISATGSGAFSVLAATGDVNDTNKTFTFASEPTIVVVNGASYVHGSGVTITGTSVELDNAVGTGGSIYGIG